MQEWTASATPRPAAFEWSDASGALFAAGGAAPAVIHCWDLAQERCLAQARNAPANPPFKAASAKASQDCTYRRSGAWRRRGARHQNPSQSTRRSSAAWVSDSQFHLQLSHRVPCKRLLLCGINVSSWVLLRAQAVQAGAAVERLAAARSAPLLLAGCADGRLQLFDLRDARAAAATLLSPSASPLARALTRGLP